MSSLVKRIITGIIYVAVIVLSILYTGWAFPVVCTIFGILGIIEFDKLTHTVGTPSGTITGFDLIFSFIILAPAIFGAPALLGLLSLTAYIILRLILQLYLHSATPVSDVAKSFLSLGWIIMPLLMLEILQNLSEALVLTLFIMIWLNDTGAFCFGSMMGRTKLFERISPKKTWEGWAGGLLVTALFGYFVPDLLNFTNLSLSISHVQGLMIGVGVSIMATFGDLVESLFKRALHAKDSGKILPGHGGILDRIDSLLLVSPGAFVVWLWLLFS